jgi:DNA-binding NtrC family response regulator
MPVDSILIVDPDFRARRVMRSLLSGHGYNVLEAGDASTAMTLFEERRTRIAVLITPVFLPEMTGAELAGYAQTWHPRVSVILTSGCHSRPFQVKGGWQVIQKPFTARIMIDLIRLAAAANHS